MVSLFLFPTGLRSLLVTFGIWLAFFFPCDLALVQLTTSKLNFGLIVFDCFDNMTLFYCCMDLFSSVWSIFL